jgi:hypothetical protein
MRKALALSALITPAFAAVAIAAGPTINVTVTPDTPSAQSTLKVSAKGPFSESGLPKSLELTVQKGFRSSAKSVPVLCNPKSSKVTSNKPDPCPPSSKIGSGKVVGDVSVFGSQTVPFTLYLGKPVHTGDIASVVLSATVPIADKTENAVGRLFTTSSGGIEILFNHLPKAPSGVTVTAKRLRFSAHAVNGNHSLITNPASCRGGHWRGTFTVTFSSGRVSKQLAIPCSK